MTEDRDIPEESATVSLLDALCSELADVLDTELQHFEDRACGEAASRLRPVMKMLESARAVLSEPRGGESRDDGRSLSSTLVAAFEHLRGALAELDFVERLNTLLTDLQMIAFEMGRAVDPETEHADSDSGDRQDGNELATLREVSEELRAGGREAYRTLTAASLRHHAAVANAATRCLHAAQRFDLEAPPADGATVPMDPAGVDPVAVGDPADLDPATPIAVLTELESRVAATAEWLGQQPLAPLRSAIRSVVEGKAADGRARKERGRPADASELLSQWRSKWDRDAPPERIRWEIDRLQYLVSLGEFGLFIDGFVTGELLREADEIASEAIDRLEAAVGSLRALHGEAAAGYEGSATAGSPRPDDLLDRGLAILSDAQDALRTLTERSPIVDRAADRAVTIADRVGGLPERVLIGPLVEHEGQVEFGDDAETVTPRDWAQDAFGLFVLERLRDAALPYSETLRSAADLLPSAQTVLEYNLGAAIEILDDSDGTADSLRSELVLGGLDRTADRLAEALTRIEEVRMSAPEAASLVLREAEEDFWARARAESSLEGHARDIWATLSLGAGRAGAWAGREGARLRRSATALFRQGAARAVGTLRRARIAVGADPVAAERVDATVRSIADVDTAASELPFVYRRVFSYRPLTDPSLLVGREATLEALDEHLERWRSGGTDALLIVGSSGVGVSSVINVVRSRWADTVAWCPVTLRDRVVDEASLARMLADALALSAGPSSLAEIRTELEERPDPELPQVCVIENLELLYRRGVLDAGLIGRTLSLMSATDAFVFWVAPLSASAWQVLTALKPGVTALARVLMLEPMNRDQVEAAILARHQRSGIPLRMEVPSEPALGVRRAMARAEDDEERQAILRAHFFDRLFELSDGYMALAILYWLRSLRLDSESETMFIGHSEAIDFAAWDDLDAAGAFALRAFLEHGSLTLDEYMHVFGTGEEQAFAVFERLGSLLLIEAIGAPRRAGSRLRFRRIDPASRYRIRPVLVRPVERLLASRRLLY